MTESLFWSGRRALVLGCDSPLGCGVVQAVVANGGAVSVFATELPADSLFIQRRLYESSAVVRGSWDDLGPLQRLLAVHEIDTIITCDPQHITTHRLLRTVATVRPNATVTVACDGRSGTLPTFRTSATNGLRVAFVRWPNWGDAYEAATIDLAVSAILDATEAIATTDAIPVNGLWSAIPRMGNEAMDSVRKVA